MNHLLARLARYLLRNRPVPIQKRKPLSLRQKRLRENLLKAAISRTMNQGAFK